MGKQAPKLIIIATGYHKSHQMIPSNSPVMILPYIYIEKMISKSLSLKKPVFLYVKKNEFIIEDEKKKIPEEIEKEKIIEVENEEIISHQNYVVF